MLYAVSLKKFQIVSLTALLSVNCLVIINLMSKFKIVARNPDDNGNSTYSSAQSIPSISMEISKRNGKLTVNLFWIENFMTFQARCWNFTLSFDFTNFKTCCEVAIFYCIVVCLRVGVVSCGRLGCRFAHTRNQNGQNSWLGWLTASYCCRSKSRRQFILHRLYPIEQMKW